MNSAQALHGSALADASAARMAVDLLLPFIDSGIASQRLGDSGFLHIVIYAGDQPRKASSDRTCPAGIRR